jgi:hypothetical protein
VAGNGIKEAVWWGRVTCYVKAEFGGVHSLRSFAHSIFLYTPKLKMHFFFIFKKIK